MKLHNQQQKLIYLISEYHYFDLFATKKWHSCSVYIPDTILLQKGYIKQWLFNSSKIANHPILKKKKQNLLPLTVVKNFCAKLGYASIISQYNTMLNLSLGLIDAMKQHKNYDFIKDKKVIAITTTDNQIHQMSLIDFLNFMMQSKYADQLFYDKWKILQERVTFNKIQQSYQIHSVRKNHLIQSKCEKKITVNNGFTSQISTQIQQDPYKSSSPSKKIQIAETKQLQAYKFFDSFLNKKFFQMSDEIIQAIEKNFKCIVYEMKSKFVINKQRQPYFIGIDQLLIKPTKKITQLQQYRAFSDKKFIKVQEYMKLISFASQTMKTQYIGEIISMNKRSKCHGQFCSCKSSQIPAIFLTDYKRFKVLNQTNRKVSIELISAVRKRKGRIIQKLKQNKLISQNFLPLNDDQSEQYQTDSQQQNKEVKVCQNCYMFYMNILRAYTLDGYGNLVENKIHNLIRYKSASKQMKSIRASKEKVIYDELNKLQQNAEKKNEKVSKPIQQNQNIKKVKVIQQLPKTNLRRSIDKRQQKVLSQPKRLLAQTKSKFQLDPLNKKIKQSSFEQKINEKRSHLLNLTKLSEAPIKQLNKNQQKIKVKKNTLQSKFPETISQALDQVINKLSLLPNSSNEQFKYYCKKYYNDNYPQYVQRRCLSSEYITNIYQFISNSPINLLASHRIKKRPEMNMRRLSQLTDYPEIVSKSTFIFDTLIINQTTTIPMCIITSKMLGIPQNKNQTFQNIFIINDMFDSFIEHISTAKSIIQEYSNKRVILFNRPGQSHTIFNQRQLFTVTEFSEIMEKLLYRLSQNQSKIINFAKDKFKFVGFGYGCYLLQSYLGYYHFYYENIKAVILFNPYSYMSQKFTSVLNDLIKVYQSEDYTSSIQPYFFYNKAIQSTQLARDDLEKKSSLNAIRQHGRLYIINSILNQTNSQSLTNFQDVSYVPVTIVYGRLNCIIPKHNCQNFLIYQKRHHNEKQSKKQIPNRRFVQCQAGHDINADNYDEVLFRLNQFIRL